MRTKTALVTALLGSLGTLACGEGTTTPPVNGPAFPELLSQLNIDAPGTHFFQPRYQLWTNGSVKARTIRLTGGGSVNTSNRSSWVFPEGTMFTKTFSYLTKESPESLRKIETRIIRLRNGEWETVAYRWREDQTDATLLVGNAPVSVTITNPEDSTFTHDIPSRQECRLCHAAAPVFILGFNELQLNVAIPPAVQTQLQQFHNNGILGGTMPTTPAAVSGTAQQEAVIGYIQGNCVHCHNAGSTGSQGFNLHHDGFLDRTVGVNGPVSGSPLITAGNPGASAIYNRFSSGSMPALGVRLRHHSMIQQMADWISSLSP